VLVNNYGQVYRLGKEHSIACEIRQGRIVFIIINFLDKMLLCYIVSRYICVRCRMSPIMNDQ
jgi:hypothetical protein